jgi:glucose-6-phosphate isomerase
MKNLKYIITVLQEYQDGKKHTCLVRICNSREEADNLLQSLYEEAESKNMGRHGRVSDPMWVNENKTQLQITFTMVGCGVRQVVKETYFLTDDWEDNIYSKTPWMDY